MKIILNQNYALIYHNGKKHELNNLSEEEKEILKSPDEENVLKLLNRKNENNQKDFKEDFLKTSKILVKRGQSVYWKGISEISLPMDFVNKVLIAEHYNNKEKLSKYKNFWTLLSFNPDSRVRNNLFWFIRKWNVGLSKSGLLICYRNVNLVRKSEYNVRDVLETYYKVKYIDKQDTTQVKYGNTSIENVFHAVMFKGKGDIYTDAHSGTFMIKLGEPVSMPRGKCDSNQEHSCSTGLHVGAKGWLGKNYCGNVGLQCLVSPMNVVAVPTIDDYGKMRCCEYLPVAPITYSNSGSVIEPSINLEDEINYIKNLKYEGKVNNEDLDKYRIASASIEEIFSGILKSLNIK